MRGEWKWTFSNLAKAVFSFRVQRAAQVYVTTKRKPIHFDNLPTSEFSTCLDPANVYIDGPVYNESNNGPDCEEWRNIGPFILLVFSPSCSSLNKIKEAAAEWKQKHTYKYVKLIAIIYGLELVCNNGDGVCHCDPKLAITWFLRIVKTDTKMHYLEHETSSD
ncbi:hypothetical protein VNO77_12183 [Canavalia gladiata]|uniref:Uncharacterized protein n=1 Tax=Canavalia gladiata TaxID=3824 RepID=A0AAN9LX23_CANGL